MKILYLSKALVVGAYQTKMEALAREKDIELVAAVPPSWRDERGETSLEPIHVEGYELRIAPLLFNGSFHGHFYPTIGQLLDDVRPDLFHIDEEAYNFATFHAAWMAHRRRIPFLFFTWQNILRSYPPPFGWMERWLFQHAAHAIAGNQDAADVLVQKGYSGPYSIIPQFGVDLRLFPMCPPETTIDRRIVFGYAGRLVEEKGLHILLEALAMMEQREWRCLIRGSGPTQGMLEAQIEALRLGNRVQIQAPLPSTEMHRFYQEIDVFVLPSLTRPNWKEQFGRVLIEAMASGAVVVGSNSGEIPHVIGKAGIVVPEGEVSSLARALQQLSSDSELRHTLRKVGRERVLEHFTQDAIARKSAEVYREVLRREEPSNPT